MAPRLEQAALDYRALDLKPFYAGALVRFMGGFHRVADPARQDPPCAAAAADALVWLPRGRLVMLVDLLAVSGHLVDGLASLPNPVGSPADKLLVGLYRLKALLGTPDAILREDETSILAALRAEGFSEAIIDRFFRPFLGGIFFDRSLGTTSRLLKFVMRMLATGENCLPSRGIGAVADQLAAGLPAGALRLGAKVEKVTPAQGAASPVVALAGGESIKAKAVVVGVEGPEAQRLLGSALSAAPSKPPPGVGTACLYFAAPRPARPGNVLYLDGEGGRLINNMCFPSEVSSTYAPQGQALVSISTIGTHDELSDGDLEAAVRREAGEWFGAAEVAAWRHLRTYRIPFAQPNQAPPTDLFRPVALGSGLYVCGDHRCSATLDGALKSGRLAAEAVIAALQQQQRQPAVAAAATAGR
ncbi:hypothetical protein N2152v2_005278 [Parachlorella kessleri]